MVSCSRAPDARRRSVRRTADADQRARSETIKERSHVLLRQSLHCAGAGKVRTQGSRAFDHSAFTSVKPESGRVIQKTLLQGTFPHVLITSAVPRTPSPRKQSTATSSPSCNIRPIASTCCGRCDGQGYPRCHDRRGRPSANRLRCWSPKSWAPPHCPQPAEIINELNRQPVEQLIQLESYATLALYRVNLPEQTLQYVSAAAIA